MSKIAYSPWLLVFIIVMVCCSIIGYSFWQQEMHPAIQKLTPFDVNLEKPKPGEWLYIHKEKGQTFEQYTTSNPVRTTTQRMKIYLQPLGDFSPLEDKIIRYTAEYLTIFFDRQAVILPTLNDSIIPITGRRRSQLHTGTILDLLEKDFPKDGIVFMALTSADLYPSDKWNFVFGQARPDTRVGVSSFFRYAPEDMDYKNYNYCLERIIKTSSHEIGHMFSCMHCTHAVCLMNGSNSLEESDSRPNRLCSECLHKLHWNLNFNVTERLAKLNRFFKTHGLMEDYRLSARDLVEVNKK